MIILKERLKKINFKSIAIILESEIKNYSIIKKKIGFY